MRDELYMRRCLDLALLGGGTVSPNPMVGAVIVHENRIIGEGFTSPFGGSHAEVNAVKDALRKLGKDEAEKMFLSSTLFVSLEPCAHFGKTPPCADMIVSYKFLRVVIGCVDPYSKVNGLGIQKLTAAGIETKVGVLEDQCIHLNRRFFTRIMQQRPYVILKWAETRNGFFAPDDQKQRWISNAASKQLTHKWRSEEDAILVGTSTALIDDPSLTTRLWRGKNPKRVVIDRDLRIPLSSQLFDGTAETIIFNAEKTDWQPQVKKIALENFSLYLPQNILYQLYLMDVQSIIIEGGAATLQSFIDAGVWDEARVFVSPMAWNSGINSPKLHTDVSYSEKVGNDLLNYFVNQQVLLDSRAVK